MANPIRSLERNHGHDIYEEAMAQDLEREIEEDNRHFRNTGENRRPRRLDNPLVDNNPSPDIANDGDSYDDIEHTFLREHSREYVEDNPSEFIDSPSQNSRRQRMDEIDRDLFAFHGININQDIENLIRDQQHRLANGFERLSRKQAVSAYYRREQEKKEKEFAVIKEKRIERSKNAIMELKVEDNE